MSELRRPSARFRLFIGLMPDAPTRLVIAEEVARLRKQLREPGVRWVSAARYHATMLFLGDHAQLPHDLVELTARAVRTMPRPDQPWVLDHATSFPGRRPPWILRGSADPPWLHAAFTHLRGTLSGEFPQLQIDARFVPHLTVAYSPLAHLPRTAIGPVAWQASRLALLRSDAGQPVYEELGSWSLRC